MREFMFHPRLTIFRYGAILSALAVAFGGAVQSANGQGINVGYAEGPAIRGTNMAMPLPPGSPIPGGPMQNGRMIHPSASPYLFQSGTSNNVIHTGANTSASFPVTGVVDVPPETVQQLGYSQSGPFSPLGSCNTCMSDSCGGCSTGACGSLGDLLPFHWIQAVGGDEYGVGQNWYSQFGIFAPLIILPDETGLSFLQANGTVAEDSVHGANVGFVTRYQDLASYWFFGSSLWYDYESNPDQDLHQVGLGVEALSRFIEVRANGYLPIGTTSRFEAVGPRLQGTNMLLGFDNLALAGADIEGGIRPFEKPELWLFLGYYFYTDQDDILDEDPLEGLRGRIELRPNQNLTLGVTVSHDDVYDTQTFASATFAFRSFADLLSAPGGCNAEPQFTQLVTRKSRITQHRQDRLARDQTGAPLGIFQASSTAAAGGNGTAEQPFNTLDSAVAAAGENGIIFVQNGTFNESINLLNGQRLLADGFLDTTPHVVSTQSGIITLPGQRTRAAVARPTITSNDLLGTVKLCPDNRFVDNVEITGFEISNTVGSGIVGILNDGLVIRDNVVTGNAGFGIALFNASGDTVNSPTAPVSAFRIQNNELTQNNQGGLLIADVDLASFNFTPTGLDINSKGVSLADRGDLNVQVSGNTISDNATTNTLSPLGEGLSDATLRDDRFGVQVVGLTGSSMTVDFESNTLERNGTAAALGRYSAAGGLSVVTGGTSTVNTNVIQSTFNRNAGTDIQASVGDGPAALATAVLNLNVDRSLLQNAQLSDTDDGILAGGIRLDAFAGTLNATVNSTVILGDTTVLNGAFDRMAAFYSVAGGNGRINSTISGTDLNPLTRTGNEFVGWHVGVGGIAEDIGINNVTIANALIDAECVLKFHSGDPGVPAASSLTAIVQSSELIARLPAASPLDGVRVVSEGGASLDLSIINSEYRFEGIVDGTTPDRNWLNGTVADSANLTLLIDNGLARNSMAGFTDFISLAAEDTGTIAATIRDTTIGDTTGQGIDIESLDSSRVTLDVQGSTLSNSGTGLVNVRAYDQSTSSSTLTSNTLVNPANQAISLLASASAPTDNARVGATLTSNQFQALSGALQATSDADDGNTEFLLNMTGNTSNGLYLLEQLQTAPGVSTFTLFDGGGNSPGQTTTGTINSSATALDITFP
ncbi:MAG: hypothetical protein ACI8P0_001168 [Planctomycetaceae bacterium]|jgi:hypothetical protein